MISSKSTNLYDLYDLNNLIYKCSKKDKICCKYGHRLIPVQGPKLRWHFRHDGPCQNKLYIKQNGAGSGKTFNIINMIQNKEFLHYTQFIYVSKQHSARAIIKDEFLYQYNAGLLNIKNMIFRDIGKKYIIRYTNNRGLECCIIISTIDAFMYAIGDKTVQTFDYFEGIVQSIIDNSVDDTIHFAGMITCLSETLYISDESQDLKELYGKALLKIIKETGMSVYAVGDQLQSISNETNAFTYLMRCEYPKYIEPAVNICRRFSHPKLVEFVNYMISYSKYKLPVLTSYHTNVYDNPLTIIFENIKINMEERIDEIMNYYKKEVDENNYLPKDFLVVTPFVSNNPFISCLNSAINEFWIQKYQLETYETYSVFHKSEIGSSINLDESKETTRIVSIHSSKGDGRNCVFVIGLHETSLKTFSGLRDTLIYDSLLHVAITRMKKKLYITCNENDEIGQRIKNYLLKNDMHCITHSLFIDPKVNVKNILPACGEKINELIVDDYQESTKPTQNINGFYTIRYGLMFQEVCKNLKDQYFDRMPQIKVIRDIALNAPIVICTSWKDYNIRLKMNTGTEENEYTDKEPSIPLLNIKGYSSYFNLIYENIEIIRNTSGNHLSCLQSIIFYYMTEVTSRGKYTHMNILELYKIIDNYESESESFESYVLQHDECMKKLYAVCEPLLELKMSWNPHVSIEYNFDIILKTQIDLIGYNKDTVILTYLKPELNRMNYTEIKIKAFIDSYIVSKCGNTKYAGKKILVCILSIHDKPYFIYFEDIDFDLLQSILKDTLFDYFSIKNKEISQFSGSNFINLTLKYIIDSNSKNLEELNNRLKEALEKI
jgi:hypothetical protein